MSSIRLGESGEVYVMINGSFPNLCKLGATTLSPAERARQLTASTSSPTPFIVAYSRHVDDVNAAEAEMHRVFSDRRVNENREYFECSVLEACLALDRIAGGPSELTFEPPTPWAELFSGFPDDGSPRELTAEEAAKCRELAGDLAAERRAYGVADDEGQWREAA